MSQLKKCICCLLTLVMLVSCGGCSKKDEVVDTSNMSEYVKTMREKYYIGENKYPTWYIGIDWWNYRKNWTEYPVLKEVSQITGVIPKQQICQDDGTKFNLMVATNRLPDIMTLNPDDPIIDKLIEGNYVYSYDELIEKYCPEFKAEIPQDFYNNTKYETNDPLYADKNGKLFGLNCFYINRDDRLGIINMNVKQDVYEAIGSPDMSTLEGFEAALRAVKTQFPSMTPLTLGDSWFRYVFEEVFGVKKYYEDADGNIKFILKDPRYRKMVEFIRRLYKDGLINEDTFSMSNQKLDEELAKGTFFCYGAPYWNLDKANSLLNAKKPGSGYIPVEPPADTGVNVKFPNASRRGWMSTFVSKKTKDPEMVIKFIRYMFGKDGNLLMNYGHENEHYILDEAKKEIRLTDEVVKAKNEDITKFENSTGIRTQRLMLYGYYEEISTDPAKIANENMANKHAYDQTIYNYKMTPKGDTPIGKTSLKLWSKYSTTFPAAVRAETLNEMNKIIDDAISEMEALNLSALENYWTIQFKKNVERFGRPL